MKLLCRLARLVGYVLRWEEDASRAPLGWGWRYRGQADRACTYTSIYLHESWVVSRISNQQQTMAAAQTLFIFFKWLVEARDSSRQLVRDMSRNLVKMLRP